MSNHKRTIFITFYSYMALRVCSGVICNIHRGLKCSNLHSKGAPTEVCMVILMREKWSWRPPTKKQNPATLTSTVWIAKIIPNGPQSWNEYWLTSAVADSFEKTTGENPNKTAQPVFSSRPFSSMPVLRPTKVRASVRSSLLLVGQGPVHRGRSRAHHLRTLWCQSQI